LKRIIIFILLTTILLGCTPKLNSIEDFSSGKYIKNPSVKEFRGYWYLAYNNHPYTFLTIAKKKKMKTVDFNFETDIIQLILTNNNWGDIKMKIL
jgi:hypothetical protein